MAANPNNTVINVNLNKTGEATIMVASLAAATQLLKSIPSIGGQIATLTGSLAIGAGGLPIKNITGNIIENIGGLACAWSSNNNSNNYLPSLNDLDFSELFGLTGNSSLDLIIMLINIQTMQLTFLLFALYYLIFNTLDFTIVLNKLNKMFPGPKGQKFISILNKYFLKFQKVSKSLIIIFIILSLIAAYMNYTYLGFLLTNFDTVVEYYINHK